MNNLRTPYNSRRKGRNIAREFVDAQQLARDHPTTFTVPDDAHLARIEIGWHAKICAEGERFWVQVERIDSDWLSGRIIGRLVNTGAHGLRQGDVVAFQRRHVYQLGEQ